MNTLNTLSIPQLQRAIAIKEAIAQLEQELSGLAGGAKPTVVAAPAAPAAKPVVAKKPTISAAGIARIKAAQKLRWAKIKAAAKPVATVKPGVTPAVKPAPAAAKPAKKKWKLSAAGLAKIKAANKAYWAKKKAAGKK
jgi:hypothetical protein